MTRVLGPRRDDYHEAIERLFQDGTTSGLSEVQLLERFAARRDGAAFAALVERHGPMVLGVCRRFLNDPNDVDDAFQAVFLVLVRKAHGLRSKELLSNWLFGVACRVAARARSTSAQRRAKAGTSGDAERLAIDHRRPADEEPWEAVSRDERRSWLHEEVERLPRRYRAPIVAFYFEGRSYEEAASLLDCPLGTVKGRLSRARDLLRKRLERRGLVVPAVALASQLASPELRAAVPASLAQTTVRSGLAFASAASLMTTSAIPTSVRTLSEGVLHAMVVTQIKAVALPTLLVAAGVLTAGASVAARQDGGDAKTPQAVVVPPGEKKDDAIVAQPETTESNAAKDAEPAEVPTSVPRLLSQRIENLDSLYNGLASRLATDFHSLGNDADKLKLGTMHRARVEGMLRALEDEASVSAADREIKTAFRNFVKKRLENDTETILSQAVRLNLLPSAPKLFAFRDITQIYQDSLQKLQYDLRMLRSPEDKAVAREIHRVRLANLAGSGGPEGSPMRELYDAYLAILEKAAHDPEYARAAPRVAGASGSAPETKTPEKPKPPVEQVANSEESDSKAKETNEDAGATSEADQAHRVQIARASAALSRIDTSSLNTSALKALERPVTLRTSEKSTLDDLLKQIRETVRTIDGVKVPVYVDPVGLKQAGASLSSHVALDLEDVPLKFSLRLMLKQLGLAYCVRDGVLIISSLEGVHNELVEAQSEQMGLHPEKFPQMGGMGGMGGGMGGMGGMGGGMGMM